MVDFKATKSAEIRERLIAAISKTGQNVKSVEPSKKYANAFLVNSADGYVWEVSVVRNGKAPEPPVKPEAPKTETPKGK